MEHGFALALVLSLACTQGGHAQVTVARLSARLGRLAGLLLAAVGASAVTAAVMALLGANLGEALPTGIHLHLAAAVLLAAATALVMPVRAKPILEPTRSLGAITLALVMWQSIDPPRLCILALAILGAAPWPVALGGALGSGIAIAVGDVSAVWPANGRMMRTIRIVMGALLAISAAFIALAGTAGLPVWLS